MKKTLLSFGYALRGVGYTVLHEGHFRFHLIAAAYITFFGLRFYRLTRAEWVALCVLFGLVMAFECINTALERLCDRVCDSYDERIKVIKDVSAGAVLVCAIAAFSVAMILFWDISVFLNIFHYYLAHIGELVILLITVVISLLFLILTPRIFGVSTNKKR